MSGVAAEPQKTTALEDEEQLRKRILTQTGKFSKIAGWFATFSRNAEAGELEQLEAPLKQLIKELLSMEYWSLRMDGAKEANRLDQESYRQKKAEQEVAIVQAQQDIEARKRDLAQALVVRQHNEEYEAVRDQLMQHQQRGATVQECEQLEADILTLQADGEKLDRQADVRRKQVALLLHCIDDLEAAVLEEDEAAAAEPEEAAANEGRPQPMETG